MLKSPEAKELDRQVSHIPEIQSQLEQLFLSDVLFRRANSPDILIPLCWW